MNRITNAISVDVEDYFHAEALAAYVRRDEWDTLQSRVVDNTLRVLELFNPSGVKATFFILGWVADRFPKLVREIQGAGHEIACHSYFHRPIYRLSPEEFREDTRRAVRAIEDACGIKLEGYRAPTFSITKNSLWALEILAEEGFQYDSSIFPIHHDLYGMANWPRFPTVCTLQDKRELLEFPLSTFRLLGTNWPFGGGGYLRIFPSSYTHRGFFELNEREKMPVIVYFHPWEVDPDQPRFNLGARSRFRHYTNLKRMKQRIADLLQRYSFVPLSQLRGAVGAGLPRTSLQMEGVAC